jgi:hypothetical protein
MRLTPRDANYVPGGTAPPSSDEAEPAGSEPVEHGVGTGCIATEGFTKAGEHLTATYVLRPELIPLYLQRQVVMKQREMVAQSPLRSLIDGTADPAENEGSEAKIRELEARLTQIKTDSIELDMNPNVFIAHPERTKELIASDIDEAVITKDENYVRTISRFLYNDVLPSLVNEMRHGDVTILGGEKLVEAIHARGINLRYLGRLAELVNAEETQDSAMIAVGQQRVHIMPPHWLELLEVSQYIYYYYITYYTYLV